MHLIENSIGLYLGAGYEQSGTHIYEDLFHRMMVKLTREITRAIAIAEAELHIYYDMKSYDFLIR